MSVLALALQSSMQLAAGAKHLNAFAWIFMLGSMGGVTILMVWCYQRILSEKAHFDPDGTGPAHAPVHGRAEGADD